MLVLDAVWGDGVYPEVGVGGACAICATPGFRSMESKVVGFVLADMLLNVRRSLMYDEDE